MAIDIDKTPFVIIANQSFWLKMACFPSTKGIWQKIPRKLIPQYIGTPVSFNTKHIFRLGPENDA